MTLDNAKAGTGERATGSKAGGQPGRFLKRGVEEPNRRVYEDPSVVREYLAAHGLQKPEESIFRHLEPYLNTMRVLDIGIGGGRTTAFLAPRVGSYVGVDNSKPMVEACAARFRGQPRIQLDVADARNLTSFTDGGFDLVLFSYNGIDYLDIEDRVAALREINRVLCDGGRFVFSTHNARSLASLFALDLRSVRARPWSLARRAWLHVQLRMRNPKAYRLLEQDFVQVNDGAQSFRLRTAYSTVSRQMRELRVCGFGEARIFGLDGREIGAPDSADVTDPWLYYLCSARSRPEWDLSSRAAAVRRDP